MDNVDKLYYTLKYPASPDYFGTCECAEQLCDDWELMEAMHETALRVYAGDDIEKQYECFMDWAPYLTGEELYEIFQETTRLNNCS